MKHATDLGLHNIAWEHLQTVQYVLKRPDLETRNSKAAIQQNRHSHEKIASRQTCLSNFTQQMDIRTKCQS